MTETTRSQGKRGRDQTTKSDYEKLRDRNIAERQAALLASGLLEDIGQYKTVYLGGQNSAKKLCPAASASTERPIRMLQCRQCQVQVPRGMMASHKEYYHAKIKVSKSTLGNGNKEGNVMGASEIKCNLCDERLDQKMMAIHKKYYHSPSQPRSPKEMGFRRQQYPSKHQKLAARREMARKHEQGKRRDLFMRKEVARKQEIVRRKEAARGLVNDHTYVRSFSNELLEAEVVDKDRETGISRKRPADECFPELRKSPASFFPETLAGSHSSALAARDLQVFQKPTPVRELFPVQELDLVQKPTPVKELFPGQELNLVQKPTPVQELNLVKKPTPVRELFPAQELNLVQKPTPVRELFPVQELNLVLKQTPAEEIILGLNLPLVQELHTAQEPLIIQEDPKIQDPVLQLPQIQEQPNFQELPQVQESPTTSGLTSNAFASKEMKCDQCDDRFPVDVDEGVLVHDIKTTHVLQFPKVEQPEPTVTREEGVPSQEVLMSSATSGSAQDVAEEATVTCPLCSAMFGSWNLLTIHIQHYHCDRQVIQSYPCPHCPASFQGPNNLLTHVKEAACGTKRERMKTDEDQCVSLVSDEEGKVIENCNDKQGNKEESKVFEKDFVIKKTSTNEISYVLIDEEEEVKKEFMKDKEISIVHYETVTMDPSTASLPPEDTKSKAQRMAEELARKGFSVSLVSPDQQELQNTVRSLKVADKQLFQLLAKVRNIDIQEEGREGVRRATKKKLKEVLDILDNI